MGRPYAVRRRDASVTPACEASAPRPRPHGLGSKRPAPRSMEGGTEMGRQCLNVFIDQAGQAPASQWVKADDIAQLNRQSIRILESDRGVFVIDRSHALLGPSKELSLTGLQHALASSCRANDSREVAEVLLGRIVRAWSSPGRAVWAFGIGGVGRPGSGTTPCTSSSRTAPSPRPRPRRPTPSHHGQGRCDPHGSHPHRARRLESGRGRLTLPLPTPSQ
jgi:hypothetical protein